MSVSPTTPDRYAWIPGYRGSYKAGTDGSIWSKKSGRWRRMKGVPHNNGYLGTALSKDGKSKQFLIHVLILNTFVEPCPVGMQCRHYPNRNKHDNRIENISWDTPEQNQDDRIEQGTYLSGELAPSAKLTRRKVRKIRKMCQLRIMPQRKIAKKFRVSRSTVQKIFYGEVWL